jgi:hypothetical protein
MTPEEVIQTLKGVLIVNRKEEEAVRYAVECIRKLEKIKEAIYKTAEKAPRRPYNDRKDYR